ncbi:carbohydrate ABC transporter substrate-binding protein [Chloroflexota bacterium]|nr:carbohydrate ABC transporter substrate-binding protein [Chloroflexota bacterium]
MGKKIVSLLFIFVMLAGAVTACTQGEATEVVSGSEDDGAEEVTGLGNGTLHIIGSERTYPGEAEAWDEVIADFEEEYGVTVEVKWQGAWNEVPQMLETARMAGEPVDISSAGAGLINTTLVRSGIAMDLTEYIEPFQDRFSEGSFLAYTIDDKVWGIPFGASSTTGVIYNKTMFDELGLEEPTTYEELLAVAKVIEEEKGIIPMIHDGKAPWFWPIWYFEAYAQTTGNTSIANIVEFLSGNKQFTGEAEMAAFDKIAQFYSDGILTQESLDTDSDAKFAVFAQEKAAMFYAGTWHLSPVRAAVEDAFEIGIFEFPIIVEGSTSQHGGGPGDCFMIPSFADPANYGLSRQFFEFISRPENATKILSRRDPLGPSIAAVPSTDTEPLAEELVAEFYPNTITFLDWIWPVEVNDAFVSGIPAVLTGNMTSEEATQAVQNALDTLIEEEDFQFDWWSTWTVEDWDKVTMKNLPEIEVID